MFFIDVFAREMFILKQNSLFSNLTASLYCPNKYVVEITRFSFLAIPDTTARVDFVVSASERIGYLPA